MELKWKSEVTDGKKNQEEAVGGVKVGSSRSRTRNMTESEHSKQGIGLGKKKINNWKSECNGGELQRSESRISQTLDSETFSQALTDAGWRSSLG